MRYINPRYLLFYLLCSVDAKTVFLLTTTGSKVIPIDVARF